MCSGSCSTGSRTRSSYLFRVRESRQTIRDIAEAVMRRVVGNRLGSDVLTVGRVAVSAEVKEEMQKILSEYETGVRLVTVELQDVTPPDPVKPAFNEVNEARQDRERTINQAQEQANREIPKARGEATRTVTEAEGYAVERVNRANGEATRFRAILAEYQRAPEVTRRRLYLEAMGGILPEAKALYIVDSDQKALLPWLRMESGQTCPAAAGKRREESHGRGTAHENALNIGLALVGGRHRRLSGTFYTLEEGEQAVIVQFGRPVGDPVTEAGLHVKLPLIQEVRRFEKRLLIWDGDPNQIPTKGREFIWVDTTARWRIADAKKFLENVASEAGARSRLNDIIDSVVRDQVSGSELVELVRSASWEVPKGEILEEVPAEVREELKKRGGARTRGDHPHHPGRGPQGHPPVRDRAGGCAHQAPRLRAERAREGLCPDDLGTQADRGAVPLRGRRPERRDPGDHGEGAAPDPLHRLPAGPGNPRKSRRRGDARVRGSLRRAIPSSTPSRAPWRPTRRGRTRTRW